MTTGSTSKENGTHQTPNNQTDDLDDLEIPDPDDPVNSLPVPPDGGWGWVIMFASLMCNVIVDGVCFSFGIFFVEFLDYFKEGAAKTAWVGSLLPGMYLSAGPVVSALANKYGCRSVTIAGAILAAISFIASTFSPNVDVLIITYGVLGGLGFGLMYLPAIVIVGFYFDKRRALATGIAVCGSGIGTFIFAPLTRFLISTYGWKGGLWIISGITLNGIVCGALFRPLTGQYLTKKSNRSTHNEEVEDQKVTGEIMKRIIEDKKRLRTVSTGSLDGTVITKDNTLIKDPEVIKKLNLDTNKNKFNAMKPLLETEDTEELSTPIYKPNGVAKKHIVLNKNIARVQSLEGLNLPPQMRNRTRSDCSEIRKKKNIAIPVIKPEEEAARPMYRQDIFFTGSISSIAQYQSSQDMGSYVRSVTSIPKGEGSVGRCVPITHVLKQMFDFSLMRSLTFCIMCTSSFLAMTGFFTPFVYTTSKALTLGVSPTNAALLISILGVSNTVGRIVAGWISDRPWADALLISNVALIIAGVSSACVPFFNNYGLLAAYCVVFGLCIACFISLRSIILVDLLGLEKLTNSFGLLLLFQGLASIIGSPLAGWMVDLTGSYAMSYVVAGVLIGVAGLLCLPVRRIARWERNREKRRRNELTDAEYSLVTTAA